MCDVNLITIEREEKRGLTLELKVSLQIAQAANRDEILTRVCGGNESGKERR